MRLLPRATVFAFVLTTGCVTQTTYDALATQKGALESTLAEKNKAIAEQEARQKKLESTNQDLAKQLSAEQDKTKDLSARIDRLVADMAAATKDKSRLHLQ